MGGKVGGSGGGGTQTIRSDIPDEYKQFANENLTLAGTIANKAYVPNSEQRMAGHNADHTAAMNAMRTSDLGGGVAQSMALSAAPQVKRGAIADVSAGQGLDFMGGYMNPYENTVVNNTVSDMARAHTITQNQRNAQAAGVSAFGGSRHGVATAEGDRNFIDRVGNTVGQLRHTGFTTAAGLGQQDAGRDLTAQQSNQAVDQAVAFQNAALDAQHMDRRMNAAQQGANADLAWTSAMMGIGDRIQGLDQANMDLAYQDFIDQDNDDLRKLNIRMGALGQTPMGQVQRVPVQRQGMDLGGLLSGGAAMVSAFCWVAREVYGEQSPKWRQFRRWLLDFGSDALLVHYATHGPAIAEMIRGDEEARGRIRAMMDSKLEAAA